MSDLGVRPDARPSQPILYRLASGVVLLVFVWGLFGEVAACRRCVSEHSGIYCLGQGQFEARFKEQIHD